MNNDITTHHNEMISDDTLTTVYANQHISKSVGQPEEEYDALRLNYSRKWARLEDALLFKFREDLEKGNSLSWINKTEEKGHKMAVYRQMRGEQKDIYMHHMDSASNAMSVAGKPHVQAVDVARLAWSSYTGRDMVQSIDIPESFDFTF